MIQHAILDKLTPQKNVLNDNDTLFRLDEIKALPGVTVTEPLEEAYLAVVPPPDGGVTVHFAFFEWVTEDDGEDPAVVYVKPVFVGEGTGGSLREMRHIWWGPDDSGYLFYMPLKKTMAALWALQAHFDDH